MLDYSETIGNDALGGLSHPTWKGIGTLTYARDGFQIGARARYIGKMGNSQNVNSPLSLEGVKAITYVDLFARINVNERSEEHTSELQSLMRSSNAVFSLKKKNQYRISTVAYKKITQINNS